MDDALLVRSVQGVRNLNGQFQRLLKGERLRPDHVLQCLSFQQFHGDELPAVGFVNLVNRADVGMVQGACRARLALESFERLRIARQLVRKKFQRHVAAKLGVFGFVNDTHTTAAEFLQNPIVGNGFADQSTCLNLMPCQNRTVPSILDRREKCCNPPGGGQFGLAMPPAFG